MVYSTQRFSVRTTHYDLKDPQLSQCKKKKRKNTGLNVLMELEKQGIGAVMYKYSPYGSAS